jgi:VWFA-related protein
MRIVAQRMLHGLCQAWRKNGCNEMRSLRTWVIAAALVAACGGVCAVRLQAQAMPAQQNPPANGQNPPSQTGPTPSAQTGSTKPAANDGKSPTDQDTQPATQPAASPTSGQQGPGQAAQPPAAQRPKRVISNLVLVPVTVKSRTGEIVGDLRRNEFRIFEDGKEQQMALFTTDPYPLSVVVVLDNDLASKTRDQVQKSLDSIAGGLGPQDEAAIMLYNEFPEPVLDFTKNTDVIMTKLQRLRLGGEVAGNFGGPMAAGPTVNNQSQLPEVPNYGKGQAQVDKDMDDAVHAAGELLKSRGRDRRKIIFLISDGQNSHHNKWSFEQTRELLLSSDISVYTVTVGTILLKHEPGHMTRYATDTGGDSYFASKQNELERLYSGMTEEARNQYTLAYVPQNTKQGEYHSIEVRVERPGLRVNSRQGYFVGPKP